MTWDELKEKAKEMGAKIYKDLIEFNGLMFWSFGVVEPIHDDVVLERDRTPEQMYAIMEALK